MSRYGLRVDLTPDEAIRKRSSTRCKAAGHLKGARVLLPRADIAREVLADQLRDAGADVTEVAAYRTMLGGTERDGDQDIYRMLLDRQIDAITFTSASTVKNFAKIFGEEQVADLLRTTVVASIGPVTAEAAQQLGIKTTVMPERYTIPDLVDALVEHFRVDGSRRRSVGAVRDPVRVHSHYGSDAPSPPSSPQRRDPRRSCARRG